MDFFAKPKKNLSNFLEIFQRNFREISEKSENLVEFCKNEDLRTFDEERRSVTDRQTDRQTDRETD